MAEELLRRIGRALGGSGELVEVSHVHASGISYSNIGDAGLEFILDLLAEGARARVFATFNPAGVVLDSKAVGEEDEYLLRDYEGQWRIIRSLLAMGFRFSATCIPYILRRPRRGEHLAWGESSAAATANMFFAAMTNKEAGPVTLLAAATGKTYLAGVHLGYPEPGIVFEAEPPRGIVEAGALGALVAQEARGTTPLVRLDGGWLTGLTGFRGFAAAYATYGPLVHGYLESVTPVTPRPPPGVPRQRITRRDLAEWIDEHSHLDPCSADLFFTGCPHRTLGEALSIVRFVERWRGRGFRMPVYVAVPGYYVSEPWWPRVRDYALRSGVRLLPGTCLVVAPLRGAVSSIATDSVKAAYYLPRRHGVRVALIGLEELARRCRGVPG
ncbi:MAG: DUF521 domain-containing protein [Crenarchaeota archaeon]|nr:DUF521 domain-containing protein [Thermoproteota archaeon]